MTVQSDALVALLTLPVTQNAGTEPAPSNVVVPGMPGSSPAPAQSGAATGAPGSPGGSPPSPFGGNMLWLVGIMVAVMLFSTIFGGRKEKKRRADLLSGLRRQDRVQTIGGIVGTISEINDDEVVLKLEEGRCRVSKSAIQAVLKSSRDRELEAGAPAEIKPSREKAAV